MELNYLVIQAGRAAYKRAVSVNDNSTRITATSFMFVAIIAAKFFKAIVGPTTPS